MATTQVIYSDIPVNFDVHPLKGDLILTTNEDAVKKKYYENKAYRNKYIKMYEAFKKKNITVDDLVQCVNHGGVIYTQIIKNLPDNNPEQPLHTVSVDDDGLVTVEIDGKNYEVEMKNIDKIEYDKK